MILIVEFEACTVCQLLDADRSLIYSVGDAGQFMKIRNEVNGRAISRYYDASGKILDSTPLSLFISNTSSEKIFSSWFQSYIVIDEIKHTIVDIHSYQLKPLTTHSIYSHLYK